MSRLTGLLLVLCVVGAALLRVSVHQAAGGFNPDLRAADLAFFVSMAENQAHGLGMIDSERVAAFNRDPVAYRLQPAAPERRVSWFYFNDPALAPIIRAACQLFGNGASPGLALLWLQIIVDVLNVLVMFWLGKRCAGPAFGIACAALYAGYLPWVEVVATHAYYFYWTGCFALWSAALVSGLSDEAWTRRPLWQSALAGSCFGFLVGCASLLRPTFGVLGVLAALFVLIRWRRAWRKAVCWGLAVALGQALVMAPLSVKSQAAFGTLRPPRAMWHMIYIGFGAHPNPYGIKWDDDAGFKLGEAHGIIRVNDPIGYERVLRDEVMRMHRADPWQWPRNALHNLWYGVTMGYSMNNFVWPGLGTLRLPESPAAMLVALLLGVAVCCRLSRQSGDPWSLAFVMLQGAYFVAATGLLIPTYFTYNAAFVPTYVVAVAALLLAAVQAMRYLVHRAATWLTAVSPPSFAVLAGGAIATALCWLPLPASPGLDVRAALLLTAPLSVLALRDLLGGWLGPAGQARPVWLCLLQAVAAFALYDMLDFRLHRLLAPALLPALGLTALATRMVAFSPLAALGAGSLIAIGSALHPSFVLLPWILTSLLQPWPGPVRQGMVQAAASSAVILGALHLLHVSLPADALIAAVGFLIMMVPGVDRAPRWLRWTLAAVLVVLQFHRFAGWSALALILLYAWWQANRGRQEGTPERTSTVP